MNTNIERNPSEDRLGELLFGRRVVKAEILDENPVKYEYGVAGSLVLDDGTRLVVGGNTGGCSCGAGDYDLTSLNTLDSAIMGVRENVIEHGKYGDRKTYEIFVLSFDKKQHLLASFDGDDGNGYYGTGWWLTVIQQGPPQDPLAREADS